MRIHLQQLLLLNVIAIGKGQKLLEEENRKRIQECGRGDPPALPGSSFLPFSPSHFFVKVIVIDNDKLNQRIIFPEEVIGTFISPRHVLTTSHPFINRTSFSDRDYPSNAGHKEVHMNRFSDKKLIVAVKTGPYKEDFEFLEARKMWILRFSQGPMLIELQQDRLNVKFACLARSKSKSKLREGNLVHIYGHDSVNIAGMHYERQAIQNFDPSQNLIFVGYFDMKGDKGGPMMASDKDGRKILVGISALETRCSRSNICTQNEFLDLRGFTQEICDLTGICEPGGTAQSKSFQSNNGGLIAIELNETTTTETVSEEPDEEEVTREATTRKVEDVRYPNEYEDENETMETETESTGAGRVELGVMVAFLMLRLRFQ